MWGISSFELIVTVVVYFMILISSIIITLKNEYGKHLFMWLIISILIPFFGSLMYLIYYFSKKKI